MISRPRYDYTVQVLRDAGKISPAEWMLFTGGASRCAPPVFGQFDCQHDGIPLCIIPAPAGAVGRILLCGAYYGGHAKKCLSNLSLASLRSVSDDEMVVPNPCSGWLSDDAWDSLRQLDELPPFRGLLSSFGGKDSEEWRDYAEDANMHECPAPGDWNIDLNNFQRLLLHKALRPGRLLPSMTQFVASELGRHFIEPSVRAHHAPAQPCTALYRHPR